MVAFTEVFNFKNPLFTIREKIVFLLISLVLLGLAQLSFFPILKWIKSIPDVKFVEIPVQISVYLRMIQVIVISPLIEEMIFRLPLRFSKPNLTISIVSFFILLLLHYEVLNVFLFSGPFLSFRLLLLLFLISIVIISLKFTSITNNLDKIWHNKPMLIILLYCIAFSMIHIRRFEIETAGYYYIGIIILIYYFLVGIIYSLIRLKVGIFASFVFHAAYNSVVYLYVLYLTLREGRNYFEFL